MGRYGPRRLRVPGSRMGSSHGAADVQPLQTLETLSAAGERDGEIGHVAPLVHSTPFGALGSSAVLEIVRLTWDLGGPSVEWHGKLPLYVDERTSGRARRAGPHQELLQAALVALNLRRRTKVSLRYGPGASLLLAVHPPRFWLSIVGEQIDARAGWSTGPAATGLGCSSLAE